MKAFIYLIFGIFLLTLVSATDVTYKIKIIYEPNCTTGCINQTIGGNLTSNCTMTCTGLLKVLSGEDNNYITVIENIQDIGGGGKTYTGYKSVTIAENQTDVSALADKLSRCMEYEGRLNNCMDSNRNISAKFIEMQDDIGYKVNYTECDNNLRICNLDLTTNKNFVAEKEEKIKSSKNNLYLLIVIAFVLGIIAIKFGYPMLKGRGVPKDPSESQFPANQGYY